MREMSITRLRLRERILTVFDVCLDISVR